MEGREDGWQSVEQWGVGVSSDALRAAHRLLLPLSLHLSGDCAEWQRERKGPARVMGGGC